MTTTERTTPVSGGPIAADGPQPRPPRAKAAARAETPTGLTTKQWLSRWLADFCGLFATTVPLPIGYWLMDRVGDLAYRFSSGYRANVIDNLRHILGEEADLDEVEANLRSLGYRPPDGGAGSGGTWVGSADLAASIDPALTPVQQNFAVLPDEGLVLMSDAPEPVAETVSVIESGGGGLSTPLASVVGDPTNAVLWASDFACADLAMSQAGPEDQRQAAALVQQAGDVSPLSGLLIAQQPDRTITVAMRFESDEQASANLQPRVDLAAGEAPGQGGSFAERFRVVSGEASGRNVVLQLRPRPDREFLFSDITSGPVLFATC